ncbi:hypothetical protein BDC45DRAFT_531781 [Circinella umbellata]|nr:hypothetical protein BDC45DRAFT_531781 [Circinella umbellata]
METSVNKYCHGVIRQKDDTVVLAKNDKSNKNNDESYNNNVDHHNGIDNTTPPSTATLVGVDVGRSIWNGLTFGKFITQVILLFRQRMMKIKMNNNKNMKGSPVALTTTVNDSSAELNDNTLILHYLPRPVTVFIHLSIIMQRSDNLHHLLLVLQ